MTRRTRRRPVATPAAPPATAPAESHGEPEQVEDDLEPGETLQEAEEEIGINPWLDAETGEPAEGQSPPHLERE